MWFLFQLTIRLTPLGYFSFSVTRRVMLGNKRYPHPGIHQRTVRPQRVLPQVAFNGFSGLPNKAYELVLSEFQWLLRPPFLLLSSV